MKTTGWIVLSFFALSLISCAAPQSSDGLVPTIYFKPTIRADQTKCSSSSQREILSPEGYTLATLCDSDYKQCLMQGSCFVEQDGVLTSYNYHSTKEGVARFIVTDLKECPFGYGVQSSCLDPFYSVAADLDVYGAGDVIFVPRLVGARLPNGQLHDGFLIIRDSGGGIKGADRFDFFTGFLDHRTKENPFARLGFGDPKNRFQFRLASKSEALAARQRRGYPGLNSKVMAEGLSFDPVSK